MKTAAQRVADTQARSGVRALPKSQPFPAVLGRAGSPFPAVLGREGSPFPAVIGTRVGPHRRLRTSHPMKTAAQRVADTQARNGVRALPKSQPVPSVLGRAGSPFPAVLGREGSPFPAVLGRASDLIAAFAPRSP